jgi:crotonobetaine/carnitine-CoA ligase
MSSFDPETSGQVRRDLEVMIADDRDRALPSGTVGEILVRGKEPGALFQGYVDMPEETVKACRNLWFHTGDLGRLDERGRLFFMERKRDRIRVGGNNVSSWEVESVVDRHDKVVESVIIGVKNPLGEDDIALFVLKNADVDISSEEVVEFCRRNLAEYMVPRFVVIMDSLPKTETGKPAKGRLQALFESLRASANDLLYERSR